MRVGVWTDTRRRVNRRVDIRGFFVLRDMSDKFQPGHVYILENNSGGERSSACPRDIERLSMILGLSNDGETNMIASPLLMLR